MKKYVLFFLMTVLSLVTLSRAFFTQIEAQETPSISTVKPLLLKTENISVDIPEVTATPVSIGAKSVVSDTDIELIALLTMAEAEGECEEGQRLVIDTVLNRVDNPHFPDNIYDVVYQKNQYCGTLSVRRNLLRLRRRQR